MFSNSHQSGFISIFFSVGSNPLALWDKQVKNGHIRRVIDDEVKSLVLDIGGTNVATTYITCPIKPRASLNVKLPYFVMVIKNMKKYFSFEIQILDDKEMRRRFRVSNFQSTTKVRPFCTTMPIGLSAGWNQVQFNLADFTKRAYGSAYMETVRVQIHANVRIRRIYFTDQLHSDEELPNEFKLFAPGPRDQKGKGKEKKSSKDTVESGPGELVPPIKAEQKADEEIPPPPSPAEESPVEKVEPVAPPESEEMAQLSPEGEEAAPAEGEEIKAEQSADIEKPEGEEASKEAGEEAVKEAGEEVGEEAGEEASKEAGEKAAEDAAPAGDEELPAEGAETEGRAAGIEGEVGEAPTEGERIMEGEAEPRKSGIPPADEIKKEGEFSEVAAELVEGEGQDVEMTMEASENVTETVTETATETVTETVTETTEVTATEVTDLEGFPTEAVSEHEG